MLPVNKGFSFETPLRAECPFLRFWHYHHSGVTWQPLESDNPWLQSQIELPGWQLVQVSLLLVQLQLQRLRAP